jgi:outer membrane protein, heavy metal efflux system
VIASDKEFSMISSPSGYRSAVDVARREAFFEFGSLAAKPLRLPVCAILFALGTACASTTEGAPPLSPSAELIRTSDPGMGVSPVHRNVFAGSVLHRAAYVRAVLRSNPSVESARQSFRAALARAAQAGTFEDPMVELGIAPLSVGSSKAPFGYEVGVSQKLPWFGKRSLEQQAGAAEAAAARSDFESVKRELALTAVLLHDEYFVATRSLEINAAHVELMRALHASAVAQFSSGRGSAQDALQAESELAHLDHDALILASQRDVTVAQMNELLHRAPELPLPPPPEELVLPAEPDFQVGRSRTDAIRQRPDIVALEQRARAESARAERAEREAYPDLTVSTSYSSMWDMPEHRWLVGLGLNLPIQTGQRAGAADEARAMRAQLQSDAARMTDAARTQVFATLRQLEESKHVLSLYEARLLPISKQQIDAARAGFIGSRNPFMVVIEAERNLRGVELEYQLKRAEYVKRRAELDRALGLVPGLDWKEGTP